MGFEEVAARCALDAAGGNVAFAVDLLEESSRTTAPDPAAPRFPSSGAEGGDGCEWRCAACTLLNDARALRCDACGAPCDRPPKMRKVEVPKPVLPVPALPTPAAVPALPKPAAVPAGPPKAVEGAVPTEPVDDNAPKEYHEVLHRLTAYFLSAAACTELAKPPAKEKLAKMPEKDLRRLVRGAVPDVDAMLDRTQSQPVMELILSTYKSGLPALSGNSAVHKHTIYATRFIFDKVAKLPQPIQRRHLSRLAVSFTACQAEQGRVIDAIYGELSGRDKGLREQVLALVDDQKQRVLDQVTHLLNPDAWHQDDSQPAQQVPHIQSSYIIAVGKQLGLRGVGAAHADKNAFKVPKDVAQRVQQLFRLLFSSYEVAQTLLDDINQQAPDADRVVDRDVLFRWAGDSAANKGFPQHMVFYDEDSPKGEYADDAKPLEQNKYQPFLSKRVSMLVLQHLFLK
eukprot:TRINITY_DN4758_c0_g1_i2.p2 TRINITY_DN4758_c0_g1~~TRINITY_DN4758_c0_g1_i2.p2  ORF type:complete len:463 (-),score=144.36 TRINITY_DN4758_c0_g1_i2:1709-3076(-)